MATEQNQVNPAPQAPLLWAKLDKVWLTIGAIVLTLFVLVPAAAPEMVMRAVMSVLHTVPFILFAILAVAYLKATDAEHLIAKAFTGSQTRMIVLAACFGGMSPFCSCEVIPFVAGMLAVGVPLAPVMALWLSSPLMDPAMFSITSAAIGVDFAMGKAIFAIGLGIFGGFSVRLIQARGVFSDVLRNRPAPKSCCSAKAPYSGQPVWRFWGEANRRATFGAVVLENGKFLLKWLSLAYLIEAIMLRYIPSEMIASYLGGEGLGTILLAALMGGPAYLNGYAAVPLVSGLLEQGMSQGAAMAFVLAGGVSCIPAAIAVWALVKSHVFATYLGLAFVGSVTAGLIWQALA